MEAVCTHPWDMQQAELSVNHTYHGFRAFLHANSSASLGTELCLTLRCVELCQAVCISDPMSTFRCTSLTYNHMRLSCGGVLVGHPHRHFPVVSHAHRQPAAMGTAFPCGRLARALAAGTGVCQRSFRSPAGRQAGLGGSHSSSRPARS